MVAINAARVRLDSLTGLRFYAALIVVLFHSASYLEVAAPASKVTGLGYTGVSFFFILSGFVLAWSRKPGLPNSQFYWRRFARVWPLHALTTALAAVSAIYVTGTAVNWAALPAVATLTQSWFPSGDVRYAFNGVSWSLSCEMFFYLLFPFIYPRLRFIRPGRAMLVITGAMVFAAGVCAVAFPSNQLGYLLYTLPGFRLGEFMIGICLALLLKQGWTPRFSLTHALVFTAASYAMIMVATDVVLKNPERLPYFVADLWMLPGFAAIIATAASRDLRSERGHLTSRPLVKLGEWSFALYLVHEIVIHSAVPFVTGLPTAVGIASVVGIVVVSVALSGALHEWVERPLESRIRAWAGRKYNRPTHGRRALESRTGA